MEQTSQHRVYLTILVSLFFVSGFAALVYQVLWVRELGLLFGGTAQAAALAISIFFAGIASGSWAWGRFAPRFRSTLPWFGVVEICAGFSALGHFFLLDAYHALYPWLYAVAGHSPALTLGMKILVATIILFPPAFFMGGTLPLMSQYVIRQHNRIGRVGARLYAVNTAGSALGALAAGFVLPMAMGFRNAYLLAVGLDVCVGLLAIVLTWTAMARRFERTPAAPEPAAALVPAGPAWTPPGAALPAGLIWVIAFGSGFATLATEVIWTRLFSQVLQNSVYTYSLVLTVFLVALALGAALSSFLCREWRFEPPLVLGVLLGLSGLATASSPWIFHEVTNGLTYLGGSRGFGGYIAAVTGAAVLTVLLPGVVLGAVFPYLMRMAQSDGRQPGEVIGRLLSADTGGSILGALAGGFVLLPLFGAWRTLLLLAALYPMMLAALVLRNMTRRRLGMAACAAAASLVLASINPQALQRVQLGAPVGDRIIEVKEGAHATVAVVEAIRGGQAIRVNTHYVLGSTRNLFPEQNQTVIPMLAHAAPESVFYLGMGTGITAGASLAFPVERVVVCEILPEVVELAGRHFEPWINGLYRDERVTIHAEDGRNCLARSPERFDVIISDLFTPWKQGTGNLYTLENYQTAKTRLNPGGVFVQWLPLYQVSDLELGVIARTMDEVFPQVTLWRGDLFPSRSIVALVGQREAAPLEPGVIAPNGRILDPEGGRSAAYYEALVLRHYSGNVTESGLFADYPLNTDAYPIVEYSAPRSHRKVFTGEARFLIGGAREEMYENLRRAVPPARDPYLAALTKEQLGYVEAGHAYSQYVFLSEQRRQEEADQRYGEFLALSPASAIRHLSPAQVLLPQPQ